MCELLALQSSQPLLRILNLSNTRVSVFPEVEEFLVILQGFSGIALLFIEFADHSLLRKIHPAQEVLEAGVGAQGVEKSFDLELRHHSRAILVGLF